MHEDNGEADKKDLQDLDNQSDQNFARLLMEDQTTEEKAKARERAASKEVLEHMDSLKEEKAEAELERERLEREKKIIETERLETQKKL